MIDLDKLIEKICIKYGKSKLPRTKVFYEYDGRIYKTIADCNISKVCFYMWECYGYSIKILSAKPTKKLKYKNYLNIRVKNYEKK